VAEKTASFVAKNGRAFEQRIVNSAKGKTPKFAFLHESSPFNAYYEDRIVFFTNGGDKGEDKKKEEDASPSATADATAKAPATADASNKEGGNDNKNTSKEKVKKDGVNEAEEGKDKNKEGAASASASATASSAPQIETTLTARKAKSSVDPVARMLLSQRAKINDIVNQAKEMNQKKKDDEGKMTTSTSTDNDGDGNGGGGGEKSAAVSKQEQEKEQKILENVRGMEPLQPIFTSIIMPPNNITPTQLEIIKLTAQFVVLNGKGGSFLRELTVKQWGNPVMWGFLQPRHSHYAYFTQLVDLYKNLMQKAVLIHERQVRGTGTGTGTNTGTSKTKSKSKSTGKSQVLKGGATTTTEDENETSPSTNTTSTLLDIVSLKKMVGLDSTTTATTTGLSSGIDDPHHDTHRRIHRIQETAGNVSKCLEHVAYQAEYDRHKEEERRIALENNGGEGGLLMGMGGAARVDWHDFVVVETIDFALDEVVEMLPPPPPPVVKSKEEVKVEVVAVSQDICPPATTTKSDEMDESSDEDDDDEKINVVTDYAPNVVSAQAKFTSEARTHVIDPITGKSIPIADMSEHMRIQLLDPKWAKEKQKFMDKQKDSNLVGGDAIARNMNAFAKARTDLFGSSGEGGQNSAKHQEANNVIPAQPQMPQPRPMAVPPPPPPPSAMAMAMTTRTRTAMPALQVPAHPKPDLTYPTAKKAKVETPAPTPLPPIPPSMPPTAAIPPAMPPPMAVAVPTSLANKSEPQQPENDTEVIQTLSASDFASSLPSQNVPLTISVPNDPSNYGWMFNGQTISITVDVMMKVKEIKQQLQPQLGGMPVNKMQLKAATGFVKDSLSLAHLNIGPNNGSLELVPKTRGGKRK